MAEKNVTVIKIGGSLLEENHFPKLVKALVPILKSGKNVVVHGGGKAVSAMSEKLGLKPRFVNGRRFTDSATMEVVEMVLSGRVNPYFVSRLKMAGIPALGFSGRHGGLVRSKPVKSLGLVGLPDLVRVDLISKILKAGFVPVFASVSEDKKGRALNVNADEMASAIASGVKAARLILFTDVPGVLDKNGKTIPLITPAIAERLAADGTISGGMIPKIRSAIGALKSGVGEIWILEGKLPLSKARGTVISLKESSLKSPFLR
jgi:acetylglutamate kinase